MKKSTDTIKINGKTIEYHRINYCVNGNPRYVVNYLDIDKNYDIAMQKARKIGGKKYRAKWYDGGIVISSYSLRDDLSIIID